MITGVLFVGIFFSLSIYFALDKREEIERQYAFSTQAQATAQVVETELSNFTNALYSLGDFIHLSPNLSRQQFSEFANNHLSRYPDILAFSWNPMVLAANKQQYLDTMANEGFPNLVIKQSSATGEMIPDENRGFYFPVYFIEPLQRFTPILGFNFTSHKLRHQAVKLAFNEKTLTSTERLTLVDQQEDITGIILLLPIFERSEADNTSILKRRGILVEAIDISSLFDHAVLEINQKNANVLLLDLTESAQQQVLYRSPDLDLSTINLAQFEQAKRAGSYWETTMNFANKYWKIVVFPKEDVRQFELLTFPWFAFIATLLFTYLLCYYWLKRHHATLETVVTSNQQSKVNSQLSNEILERIKVENELVKFAHAFQFSADGINILDSDGNYSFNNKAAIALYGYQEEELQSLHYFDINKDPMFVELDILKQVREYGHWQGEYSQTRKDGSKFPASISLSLIKDDTGSELGILEIARDITKTTMLEAQLQQAKKMEALGTLAGGIAHDFNNVLASILGNSEMIIMTDIDRNKTTDYVSNIQDSCQRAADLVKQIMTFSRMETTQFDTIDLAHTLNDALRSVRATMPSHIHLNCSINPLCSPIKGDVTQIHQIVLNLCANAKQAIGDNSGTIAIDLQEESAISHDRKVIPKGQLRLSITDTGKGISDDNLTKIFDPFFTTKKIGDGTGLGLAVVNSIIQNHGGEVEVRSAEGQGTSFVITFPTCHQDTNRQEEKEAEILIEKRVESQSKHVLIVEDEPHICRLYQEFIKDYGYQTTVCVDGKKALDAFDDPVNHFDLVLTDQSMPNITGKELSIILLNKQPDLPIIMCTGYSEVISEEIAQEIGIKHYFLKPASLTKLMQAIDNLLKD